MDFVKNLAGGNNNQQNQQHGSSSSGEQKEGGGGFLGGLGDKFNTAAGGGKEGEKNEDYLDKGRIRPQCPREGFNCQACLDLFNDVQQVSTSSKRSSSARVHRITRYDASSDSITRPKCTNFQQSAVEQAKDEQISDFIRKQYKSTTGSDIPIKDKETRFG